MLTWCSHPCSGPHPPSQSAALCNCIWVRERKVVVSAGRCQTSRFLCHEPQLWLRQLHFPFPESSLAEGATGILPIPPSTPPTSPNSPNPQLDVTHLRERSAKMGANDWHSLDQLAKNSTTHVTRLSRSSSSYKMQQQISWRPMLQVWPQLYQASTLVGLPPLCYSAACCIG